jgi:hypothetical protein
MSQSGRDMSLTETNTNCLARSAYICRYKRVLVLVRT